MNPFNLYEAYAAVYDEDLRDELEVIDEDLSFIDDLSDNELAQIMEEILRDGEVSLNECFDAFEGEVITEAESPARARKREAREAERKAQFQKATRPARARGRLAMQRLSQATSRAAERIRSGAESAKTMAGGAVSALAGGAAEAGRKGKAAAQRVGGKLAAAKERISGFVKSVGKTAGAGVKAVGAGLSAAKKAGVEAARAEYQRGRAVSGRRREAASSGGTIERGSSSTSRALTGTPERKALPPARTTSRALTGTPERKALPPARTTGRALTGTPERKALPPARTTGKRIKVAAQKLISGTAERKALPPVGTNKSGNTLTASQRKMQTTAQNRRLAQRLGMDEETILMASSILEDLIYEGYANDYNEALYVLESMSDYEVGELAESYLVEEDFEAWVDGLWEEGYDLSDYTWEGLYEAYVDEAADNVIMTVKSPKGEERSKIRKGASRPSDSHRHETPGQIANRRFSQMLSDRGKNRESEVQAQRFAYLTKSGIERATNRSDRDENDFSDVRLNAPKPKPARELRGAERQRAFRDIRQKKVDQKFKDQRNVEKFRRRHGLPESYDAYDEVLNYLLDEGYAESVEDATTIMANMSEEWRDEIIDEANKAETMLNLSSRAREQARNLNKNTDTPIFYKNRSMGRTDDPILNRAHKGMTATRRASHKAGRNLRGDTGAAGNVIKSRYQANKDHKDGYPSIRRVDT